MKMAVADKGPRLTPAAPAVAANVAPDQTAAPKGIPKDADGFPHIAPGRHLLAAALSGGIMRVRGRKCSAADIAEEVGILLGSSAGGGMAPVRVVDHTSLEEEFDFDLEFARTSTRPPTAEVADELAVGPDLLAATEAQLGLKLKLGQKVAIDYLVVEHIDKVPTPN